jgi:large subunit ribosomal protein L42
MLPFRQFVRFMQRKPFTFPPQTNYTGQDNVAAIVETKDQHAFLAWHPKPDFPYEFSKPIPTLELRQSSEMLKDSSMTTAMSAFRNKHPQVAVQELMNLTYTTKHRWYPRARDRKAKKTPMDRKFL